MCRRCATSPTWSSWVSRAGARSVPATLPGACGARAWTDYRRMLDAGGIDAVIICLPPSERGEPELTVIDHGLHLLVEKPLGPRPRDARRASVSASAQAGVIAAVGYQWRYLDLVDRARELLAVRPPQLVLGTWLGSTPSADWWVRQVGSGGQVLEQATHILDLMRYLVGECEVVVGPGGERAQHERGACRHHRCLDRAAALRVGAIGTAGDVPPAGWHPPGGPGVLLHGTVAGARHRAPPAGRRACRPSRPR